MFHILLSLSAPPNNVRGLCQNVFFCSKLFICYHALGQVIQCLVKITLNGLYHERITDTKQERGSPGLI